VTFPLLINPAEAGKIDFETPEGCKAELTNFLDFGDRTDMLDLIVLARFVLHSLFY